MRFRAVHPWRTNKHSAAIDARPVNDQVVIGYVFNRDRFGGGRRDDLYGQHFISLLETS